MEVPTFVNELDRKMVSLIDFVMQVSNTFDMNNVIVKVCENFVDED